MPRGRKDPAFEPDHYTFRDLCRRTGVRGPTLRAWMRRSIVVQPEFRGPNTVYAREHVAQILAIKALREEGLRFDAIAHRLTSASAADIAQLAGFPPPPTPPPTPTAAPAPPPPPTPTPTRSGERWHRRVLVPGLEIHVRDDAGEVLRRLADEIVARYAAGT